mmetsp:Transcript_15434/g.25730  ORF Transcript_15434/g.25730 Transcript_15434/m.25730 type:complete len:215 (+) Transcript_15434:68-712(+)
MFFLVQHILQKRMHATTHPLARKTPPPGAIDITFISRRSSKALHKNIYISCPHIITITYPLITSHAFFLLASPVIFSFHPHCTFPPSFLLYLGKHLLERSLSCGLLSIIVASEVVALDENIGDGPLSGKLQKGILDGIAVVHLVQLDNLGIDSLVKEQILGLAAERTESLGEYDHISRGNLSLDVVRLGRHAEGRRRRVGAAGGGGAGQLALES